MNATLQSIKVNEGAVPVTEQPLWVGTSKVADSINGRQTTMAISRDGEWLWVRFNVYPSEKYATLLKSAGFTWSKKRKAHHAPISQLAIKTLRNFGADTLDHHRLVGSVPPKTVEMVRMNVDLDAQVEHVDTPPAPKQPKVREEKASTVGTASSKSSSTKRDDVMVAVLDRLAASEARQAQMMEMMMGMMAKMMDKVAS